MTTPPSQPTNEELAAAREIHPEYSQEWFNKLDKTTSSYTYFKSCFEDAEGKRNHYAAIIHKHNEGMGEEIKQLQQRMSDNAMGASVTEACATLSIISLQEERDQLRARVGELEKALGVECSHCEGKGTKPCSNPDHNFIMAIAGVGGRSASESQCPECGYKGYSTCDECCGTGVDKRFLSTPSELPKRLVELERYKKAFDWMRSRSMQHVIAVITDDGDGRSLLEAIESAIQKSNEPTK